MRRGAGDVGPDISPDVGAEITARVAVHVAANVAAAAAAGPGGVLLGALPGGEVGLHDGHAVDGLDQLVALEERAGGGEAGGDDEVADLGYLLLGPGGEADLPALFVRMTLLAGAAGEVGLADVSGEAAEAQQGRAKAGGLVT